MAKTPTKKDRLDRVLSLRLEAERIDAELREAVVAARSKKPRAAERWATWAEVGEMLGMSAAGVQRRYRDVVQPERNRGRKPSTDTPRPSSAELEPIAPVTGTADDGSARVPATPSALRELPHGVTPRALSDWSEAALTIRAGYNGRNLTNADCEKYRSELDGLLLVGGVVEDERTTWWDTEHADGSKHGIWAESWQGAVIGTAFSWRSAVVAIAPRPRTER